MASTDQSKAPKPQAREGGTGDGAQVKDTGSTAVPAAEVANAAAESLHGSNAVVEQYAQPDARALVGGSTLISDPKGDNPKAGERV